ncbi:MAG TPA: hypothetical protein PKD24_09235 [Pyrinomonadaceae bacterium]|nr:hypothetical protein [Pyrinomonadaceae bacterium]HMP65748.1 hypothetical protein [Pyrinomonadaceae bacterium]
MRRHTLMALTLVALGFASYSFADYTIKEEVKRTAFYAEQEWNSRNGGIVISGPYCYPDPHPGRLLGIAFLIGITALVIRYSRSNAVPAALALLTTWLFGGWYYWTRMAISFAESAEVKGLDRYFYNASPHDIAVMMMISFVALNFTARSLESVVHRFERRDLI